MVSMARVANALVLLANGRESPFCCCQLICGYCICPSSSCFGLLVTYLPSSVIEREKLNFDVGSCKDKEVMNLIHEGFAQFFLSLSHYLRECSELE